MQLFNKEILKKEKDANWFMPILYCICSDLRVIARKVELRKNNFFFKFRQIQHLQALEDEKLKLPRFMKKPLHQLWKVIEFVWLKVA